MITDNQVYQNSAFPACINLDENHNEQNKYLINEINSLIYVWKDFYFEKSRGELYSFVEEFPLDRVIFFQKNGILDFISILSYVDKNYQIVAFPAKIYAKTHSIHKVKQFYETNSYKDLDLKVKENTDRYLIWSLAEDYVYDLQHLVKLNNFEINEKNISEMITALSTKQNLKNDVIRAICKAI